MNTLDTFTKAYITCALWSSTDNSDESGGQPLDENFDADDISEDTLNQIKEDCRAFQEDNRKLLAKYYEEFPVEYAGRDFWLTRNGHGAGFWSRVSWGHPIYVACKGLSEKSREYGSFDLYVGDDGKIYH